MYLLDLPYYHVSFPYLNDEIINKINEQLIKNIPDDDWIKNIFRPENLDYIANNPILKIKNLSNNKIIVKLDILSLDLDIIAENVIKYICIKQYIDLLNFIK